jgi:hypothetical protein
MLDNFFWAALGFIFLSGVISAFVRLRNKDDCLKLIHDHFVTITRGDGSTVWGDLQVFSNGVQLNYLRPHHTRRGLTKSGYLMYETDMAQVSVFARYVGQLAPEEMAERRRQIEVTFRPGLGRRMLRWWRNTFDTLRDAFVKAFSLLLGQVVKSSGSQALSKQSKQLDTTGKELLGAAGDAYEPMLEAHIGQSVILEVVPPSGGENRLEVAGYLAEYSDKYVAVFNAEHDAGESMEILVPPEGEIPVVEGVTLEWADNHLRISNKTNRFLVVEAVQQGQDKKSRLGATLVKASSVRIARPDGIARVFLRWVERIDVVCPRSVARVRYVGDRRDEGGGDDEGAMAPAHFDEQAHFP